MSIVIVNHNVRHFLEQCLHSVRKAAEGIDSEVIVVDNASQDGSRDYLMSRFPKVKFIWNTENRGYAKANNQGLKLGSGRYILFLNPDTLLSETCLGLCIRHLEQNRGTGAVGVRMLDGSGRFLKESRRGNPTPTAALFKLFGLSRLFPGSRVFAGYHMGHLDPMQNHASEVLSGAFLMVRRDVLDRVGGFDEDFFMYGEDIDLSFRIRKAGFSNQYLADAAILHFKGASTEKDRLLYVRMFYKAMAVFARKHYGKGEAGLLSAMLHAGIWLRAAISATGLVYRRHLKPTLARIGQSPHLKRFLKRDVPSVVAVAGSKVSMERVRKILLRNGMEPKPLVRIDVDGDGAERLAMVDGIRNLLERMPVSELVFCPDLVGYEDIIQIMMRLPKGVKAAISANGSDSMVGDGINRG